MELSKDLKEFCKKQYNSKGGCGKCFLHNKCAVSYIITRENIDKHVSELNEAFEDHKKNVHL